MDTPGGPTDPDLGQLNYEAWRAGAETELPPWKALDEAVQRAWIAGALAVKARVLAPRESA